MAAETVRAAVRPAVNWPGLPRPPAAEKTEPSAAMPSTVPTWRSALEVPEAMPSSGPGAYERVSRVMGAKKKPRPAPAMMKGGTRSA